MPETPQNSEPENRQLERRESREEKEKAVQKLDGILKDLVKDKVIDPTLPGDRSALRMAADMKRRINAGGDYVNVYVQTFEQRATAVRLFKARCDQLNQREDVYVSDFLSQATSLDFMKKAEISDALGALLVQVDRLDKAVNEGKVDRKKAVSSVGVHTIQSGDMLKIGIALPNDIQEATQRLEGILNYSEK